MVSEYQLQVVWFKPCYSYYLCHYSSLSLGLQMKDKLTKVLGFVYSLGPIFLRVYFFDASCKKKKKGSRLTLKLFFCKKHFYYFVSLKGGGKDNTLY